MTLLYWLEQIRFPLLDKIMLFVTYCGDELSFLGIALTLYWCVNKRWGYYILSIGFAGAVCNQTLKMICRVPRPWVIDPNFTIVEHARITAGGYSFPSGHTQSAVGTYGGLLCLARCSAIRMALIVLAVLVPFSRMYLGVHTFWDVLTSVLIALLLIRLFQPVLNNDGKLNRSIGIMVGIGWAYMGFSLSVPTTGDVHNNLSGIKASLMLAGAITGFALSYIIDKKYVRFPTAAVWWGQIFKLLFGLALVVGVKTISKQPLNYLFGEYIGRFLQYFIVAVTAGILWPAAFQFISAWGRPKSGYSQL